MTSITLADIYQAGTIFRDDSFKTIYLTPSSPFVYDCNTWVYKQTPTIAQWYKDVETQTSLHRAQGSNHLSFYFPQDEPLTKAWFEQFETLGYELGILELYAIESNELAQLPSRGDIVIKEASPENIEDYIQVNYQFALPFGEDYASENAKRIRQQYQTDIYRRLIAYQHEVPVGIVNLIEQNHILEIDGFGVLDNFQHQGIGSTIQAHIGQLAKDRAIILVADGEDTARDMYIKQGYIYQGFRYQILKEQLD